MCSSIKPVEEKNPNGKVRESSLFLCGMVHKKGIGIDVQGSIPAVLWVDHRSGKHVSMCISSAHILGQKVFVPSSSSCDQPLEHLFLHHFLLYFKSEFILVVLH